MRSNHYNDAALQVQKHDPVPATRLGKAPISKGYNTPYSPKTACFASPAAPMIPASFPNSAMAIRHRSANSG